MLPIQDHSMLAYDARAIPGLPALPPLRRPPRASTRHTVNHLVRSSEVELSSTHLILIARTDPSSIPCIVAAIRRHLLPARTRRVTNAAHPLRLLHKLVQCVPYFYRYVASPGFFRHFWRLNAMPDPAPPTPSAALLLAAWARDLRKMARRNDPAAAFWLMTARNISKHMRLPRAPHTAYVYPVTANILNRIAAPLPFLNMDETKRTLRLIKHMNVRCRASPSRRPRVVSSICSSSLSRVSSTSMCVNIPNTQQAASVPTPARPERRACHEQSAKFLAVKKRHDQVACMRSRNAEEFLWSDASLATITGASTSSAALMITAKTRVCCEGRDRCVCKDESLLDERYGITPSSFADLFVDETQQQEHQEQLEQRRIEQQVMEAVESVGDTIKLPSNVDYEALQARWKQAAAAARARRSKLSFRSSSKQLA